MAKKQRRDSEQEAAVSAETILVSNWIEIPNRQLARGHQIVTAVNARTGKAIKSHEVKKIEYDVRGCRNIHVNDTDCYDVGGFVKVRV